MRTFRSASLKATRTTTLTASMAVLGVALLAGCASVDPAATSAAPGSPSPTATPSSPTVPSPSSTSPSSTSPSSSAAPSATPSTAPSIDPDAPDGQCADADLAISIGEGDPGAGNVNFEITFTNTGDSSCVLEGTPGVSIVGGGNGTQIGAPAEASSGTSAEAVTLASTGTATSVLTAVNVGTDGGALGKKCGAAAGEGYRVYAPHSFEAVFVSVPDVAACSTDVVWMHVAPVTA